MTLWVFDVEGCELEVVCEILGVGSEKSSSKSKPEGSENAREMFESLVSSTSVFNL